MKGQGQADTAIDISLLTTFFGLSNDTVQRLVEAPTQNAVNQLLQQALLKAQDFEELKAEKLRIEVELESAVRASDTKISAQKNVAAKQAKTIEDLRSQVVQVTTERDNLQIELSNLRNSASHSDETTQTLQNRIRSLESSGRDTLALIESSSTEKDRLNKTIEEQQTKIIALRRDVNLLEQKNYELNNTISHQKSKQQSLAQELDLKKQNNEFQSNEITKLNQDHAKFRKERNARMSALERDLEETSSNLDTLQRTENNLRQQIGELQTRLDEAYTKHAAVQEEAARAAESARSTFISTKKLADLHALNAETHKARINELQSQIDETRDHAAEEITKLHTEIETERADKEEAERKVAQLELQVENAQGRITAPGTPLRNGGNSIHGSPIQSAQKLGRNITQTQMYSQYIEAKQSLEQEERRSAKLQTALDELIQEMESRAPELIEMKEEQENLEAEVVRLSQVLDQANGERSTAVQEIQKWRNEAHAAAREGDILRQQLRDHSAQIRMLLVEQESRDRGLAEMSTQERLKLESAARGEIDENTLDNLSSTQRLISERLVIYRGVSDLQSRNEQLLRLTREIGDKMEGEEARSRDAQAASDAAEVAELHLQLREYKDELKATTVQIDSYMKERDMFRRMLQHRGTIPADADTQAMFGSSMALVPQNGESQTPRSSDVQDLNLVLKEQQKYFDQFRTETATDRKMLKDQVDGLTREKSELQTQVARAHAQVTLVGDRFELLQSNFKNLQTENGHLQQRGQSLAENAAKQDLRAQQVVEELAEARSLADSLRRENDNVKNEKDLWKRIEDRITDENKSLMDERSRLNKLVSDLQNLANERELTESESRRRLQSRADALENELSETKKKLDLETEAARRGSQRREFEETQNRTRIDDLVKSLGNVREELVAAKTVKDQLQARVDEMKIELRAAEEKAVALQPRMSARNSVSDGQALAPEQQLAVQVSDLRRDLDHAQMELDSARRQIEQYRKIAQTSEEELAQFSQTAEAYREETDKLVAEKDLRIQELDQRLSDLGIELSDTNAELSEIRTKHNDASKAIEAQKQVLEDEVARLTDNTERHTQEKKLYQEDLKAQADIAQQAQQSYENELVKHADAARSLQIARTELNELRTVITTARTETEAAKASLEQGQESWAEQKEQLEREMEELRRRKNDVDAQNKLLYTQIESFSAELQALRQGRALPTADGVDAAPSTESNLQEVITYLRREKEIIEVQHELSSQEATRLQQQLDYTNTQLDDVHAKLAEERKQNADRASNESSTSRLAELISELNLFRESAVTLRNEARQAREKLDERTRQVQQLIDESEPLKTRLAEAENELEMKDDEMKLLTDDRDHWRERTQNIISKYDRVDPAELEELRKQIAAFESEKTEYESRLAALQEEVDAAQIKFTEAEAEHERVLSERLKAFKDQAKKKNSEQNVRYNEKDAEYKAALAEQTRLSEELDKAKQELSEAQSAANEDGNEDVHAELHARIAAAEASAAEHLLAVENLQQQLNETQERNATLEAQVVQLETSTAVEQGEIDENDGEALANTRRELDEARAEIETLRSTASAASAASNADTPAEPTGSLMSDDVQAEVAKLRAQMDAQHQLALSQLQAQADEKIRLTEQSLEARLEEERGKLRDEIRAELIEQHSAELQKVRDEYEASIKELKATHAAEVERLNKATENLPAAGSTSTTDLANISDDQINELAKSNSRLRTIVGNSIKKQVLKEAEKSAAALAEKDEEIRILKETQTQATTQSEVDPAVNEKLSVLEKERDDLLQKIQDAESEKSAAVASAVDTIEKKTKLQLNQRDIAMAKVNFVTAAAAKEPQRPVGEVWEEAKKVKPTKPATTATTATQAAPSVAPPATSANPLSNTEKLEQRAKRFGKAPEPAAVNSENSTAPNPQATAFVPGGRGASNIPRPGAAAGGQAGFSIHGAASTRGGINGRGRGQGAGIKRSHEGGPGGDGKRARGGGPSA